MEKKILNGILISGIVLILIFLHPFIKLSLIQRAFILEFDEYKWTDWPGMMVLSVKSYFLDRGSPDYTGLEAMRYRLVHSLPLQHVPLVNYTSVAIRYLISVTSLSMLPLGIGILKRKQRFRQCAIIAISIMLSCSIVNILGRAVINKILTPYNVLSAIMFGSLLYYLTRPQVKEQFK